MVGASVRAGANVGAKVQAWMRQGLRLEVGSGLRPKVGVGLALRTGPTSKVVVGLGLDLGERCGLDWAWPWFGVRGWGQG